MKIISQITYNGLDINFMEEKGYVGYSFGFEGKNYGQKVPLKSNKRKELIEAVATLFINAIDSHKNLYDTNKTTGEGTTTS